MPNVPSQNAGDIRATLAVLNDYIQPPTEVPQGATFPAESEEPETPITEAEESQDSQTQPEGVDLDSRLTSLKEEMYAEFTTRLKEIQSSAATHTQATLAAQPEPEPDFRSLITHPEGGYVTEASFDSILGDPQKLNAWATGLVEQAALNAFELGRRSQRVEVPRLVKQAFDAKEAAANINTAFWEKNTDLVASAQTPESRQALLTALRGAVTILGQQYPEKGPGELLDMAAKEIRTVKGLPATRPASARKTHPAAGVFPSAKAQAAPRAQTQAPPDAAQDAVRNMIKQSLGG